MSIQRDRTGSISARATHGMIRSHSTPRKRVSISISGNQLPKIDNRASIRSEVKSELSNEYEEQLKSKFETLLLFI